MTVFRKQAEDVHQKMVTADLCWLTLLKWKRVAAIGLVLAAWATAAPPVVIMEPSGSELALVSREGARGWEPGDGWNEIKWIKWMQSWAAFCVYQFINMPKAGLYLEECIAHWEWINYYKSQRCPVVISRRGTAKIPTMSTTSTTTSTGFHSFGRSGEGPVGGSEVAAGWLRGGCRVAAGWLRGRGWLLLLIFSLINPQNKPAERSSAFDKNAPGNR